MRQSNPFGFGKMSKGAGQRQVRVDLQQRHVGHHVHGEFVGARGPHPVQFRRVRRHLQAAQHSRQTVGNPVRFYRLYRHGKYSRQHKKQHESEHILKRVLI